MLGQSGARRLGRRTRLAGQDARDFGRRGGDPAHISLTSPSPARTLGVELLPLGSLPLPAPSSRDQITKNPMRLLPCALILLSSFGLLALSAPEGESAPSHTTIVTGTPLYQHAVFDFGGRIADGIETLSKVFEGRGYATGLFSTHVGLHSGVGRMTEGFNESVILQNEHDSKVLDRAIDWAQSRDRPFYMNIVLMGPHAPYNKYPASDNDRYFTDDPPGADKKFPFIKDWWTGVGGIPKSVQLQGRHDVGFYLNRYDRAIRHTDELVGKFLDQLRESGDLDHTFIVVTSDHGEGLGDHDYFSHEVFLYDFLIRIPLIFAGPGIPMGLRVEEVVRHVDIAPSLLGLVAIDAPSWMAGRDLSPNLIVGKEFDPDEIALSTYRLRGHDRYSARSAKHKLIYDAIARHEEFYDLATDPREVHDLLENRNPQFPAPIYYKLRSAVLALMKHHARLTPLLQRENLSPEVREELEALGYVE